MFNHQPKKNQIAPEKVEGDKSRQRSNGRVTVSEAPAAKTSAENRDGRWYRLFSRPLRRHRVAPVTDDEAEQKHNSRVIFSRGPAPTTAPPAEEDDHRTKKKTSGRGLLNCCRRRHRVAPVTDDEAEQKHNSSSVIIQNDQVVEFKGLSDEEKAALDKANEEYRTAAATWPKLVVYSSSLNDSEDEDTSQRQGAVSPLRLKGHQLHRLGFPCESGTCYMNSCLQSLITLREFVTDIYSYDPHFWNYIYEETPLIRAFINVVRGHGSEDGDYKLWALHMFKKAVSVQAPTFADDEVKDGREFLTAFLDQMRSLASPLQKAAALMGRSYSCPVDTNLVFKMQNIRTCKRCGAQSITEEELTNISVDLVPGGSVQQLLKEYLETELEYDCECGCNTSVRRSTFLTLPRFLIIHLKRFSPLLKDVKLHDPVVLQPFRELLVTTSQADGWYKLISVISHLGSPGLRNRGRYISDCVRPGHKLYDTDDRWLCYGDHEVVKTTGAAVCKRAQRTAYIIFYQRSM